MKTTALLTAALAAGLALAPASPAHAEDYKMYAGSGCKVFGATAWTDLQFGATGIRNKTSTPKNIICPLVKDADTAWDGTSTAGAEVHLHLLTGNNTKTTTCNVYVVDSDGTLLNTYTDTVGGTPNTDDNTSLFYFAGNGSNHNHATMLCTLAAEARLVYYYLYEYDDTN